MRALVLVLILFSFSLSSFSQNTPLVKRDPNSLLNQYYFLKDKNPDLAKRTLELLLKDYPDNITGLKELGYWYLNIKDPQSALPYFQTAYKLNPTDANTALQIGYIFMALKNKSAAIEYFLKASNSNDPNINQKALTELAAVGFKTKTPVPPIISSSLKAIMNVIAPGSTETPVAPAKVEPPQPTVVVIAPPTQPVQPAAVSPSLPINVQQPPGMAGNIIPSTPTSIVAPLKTTPAIPSQEAPPSQPPTPTAPEKIAPLTPMAPHPPSGATPSVAKVTIKKPVTATLVTLPVPPVLKKPSTLTDLLNQYYKIKPSNPKEAEHILELIIQREPQNVIALTELGYLNLKNKKEKAAISNFEKAYAIKKDDKLALQIGYIAFNLKDNNLAKKYFELAKEAENPQIKQQALAALKNVTAALKPVVLPTPPKLTPKSYSEYILNQFYAAQKQKNTAKAVALLQQLLAREPDNVTALKEIGYLYLNEKNPAAAREYLLRAFELTTDYDLASQLGYIEDQLGHKKSAYHFFGLGTRSKDPKIRLQSNIAMTNLAGVQTKIFPEPYFADIYTSPFYYSRFDLGVLPIIARAGMTFGEENRGEVYVSMRYTRDDRSGGGSANANVIVLPQIFEDNTAIFGMGLRYKPFLKIPLWGYAEFGRAYDLIYRFRSRWRGDVRAGGFYINSWGRRPTYAEHLQMPLKWVADAYGDATYFTRFKNNFITVGRFRPGIRLLEYHSSYLDGYFQGDISGDTNHDFFNNYYEYGPGFLFVPYNRINLGIRFVTLRGYYIPVPSTDPNPYGSHYNNKIVLLEYYSRF